MLKSTGLVHLAAIYIDAVSVFKSWCHRKSGNLTFLVEVSTWLSFHVSRLPPTLLHDIEFSASLHGILDAPMWVIKVVW